jgi:hypothetical protein
MSQNRTRHSAEFKAKVALAALTEAKTRAEISSEYKVHSTQMPPLLPRKITQAASVLPTCYIGLPHLSTTGSASSLWFNEATSGFTSVTACCFANWELTPPCCRTPLP